MATTIQPADGGYLFTVPSAKRRPVRDNTTLSDLPSDILFNIFIRLPIKSTMQCSRVCRYWRNTILQPSFADHRLSLSPPTTLSLMVREASYCTKVKVVKLIYDSLNLEVIHEACILDPRLQFVGSCNGLVCLSDYSDKVVLCNPTLGKELCLPSAPDDGGTILALGFGYIPATHQYKIVRISRNQQNKRNICYVYTTNVCNGGAHSWRRIRGGSRQPIDGLYQRSVVYDGAVIWLANTRSDLIYFDIVTEKFGHVCFRPGLFQGYNGIGVFYDDKGISHLYIVDNPKGDFVHIWLMEDYKCLKSLELKWSIESPQFSTARPVTPLKVLQDGRLLIRLVNGGLACYDPETTILEEIGKSDSGTWLETLVSTPNILGCVL